MTDNFSGLVLGTIGNTLEAINALEELRGLRLEVFRLTATQELGLAWHPDDTGRVRTALESSGIQCGSLQSVSASLLSPVAQTHLEWDAGSA